MASESTCPVETQPPPLRWIDSADALKLVAARVADISKAEAYLDDVVRTGTLRCRCTVHITDLDAGHVQPNPPVEKSLLVLDIRKSRSGAFIMIGPAFWSDQPSLYEKRLSDWERGIFIAVLPPTPIFTKSPRDGNLLMSVPQRWVCYGAQFVLDEIKAFASTLPAHSLDSIPAAKRQRVRRTKWLWHLACEQARAATKTGIVDGRFTLPNQYGALAAIEREIAAALVKLQGASAEESSLRRWAHRILDEWQQDRKVEPL